MSTDLVNRELPDMATVIQEVIDRESWVSGQIFSESGAEDYLAPEKSVPTVYALLPGQAVLKLKDLM